MVIFNGKGVCPAVAAGRISVFRRADIQVKRLKTDDTEAELLRLEEAKKTAIRELGEIYEKAVRELGEANADIFDIHMMMLEDEDYNEAIAEVIKCQNVNAEYAVAVTADNFSHMFENMEDAYMQARAADVRDISNRLIAKLSGNSGNGNIPDEKVIICADDLAPSETVAFDKDKVLAFATAYGSSNSHTAILARSMNVPAVIGLGEEFLSAVKDGDIAIADGFSGEFILNPDEKTMAETKKRQQEEQQKKELLRKLKGKENITADGRRINIFANIGSAAGIGEVLLNDAGGIGLFRSEFLYLENSSFPTEEEQFLVYRRVLESMAGKKVIIRTVDIGADKQCGYFYHEKEENPALGLRGIRLCLAHREIFRTQLRALYRASAFGRLGIMFPMITSKWEIDEIKSISVQVKRELTDEGMVFSDETETGIMIETPAAAIISDILAPEVDFFSIGTNDLIQYTLACDRQNRHVESFCDNYHEAVMRLIELAADNAHKHGKWIGICGELAADTNLTERFLRMGIDELSVSPAFVLKVREKVRSLDLS
ncbi:MAG: phosphoenolpyruvate--protein phosphotransferase [Ruminiclostridium sp.]|nr:phosphoenolpyruvate--protein phosphotransferase [Ruminiclostridium sp.]